MALAFTPDGRFLITVEGSNGPVKVWKVPSLELATTVPMPKGSEMNLSISPDSRYVAVGTSNGAVIIDSWKWTVMKRLEGWSLQFSTDGSSLAASLGDAIVFYETGSWRTKGYLAVPEGLSKWPFVGEFRISPDGRQAAAITNVGSEVQALRVWNLENSITAERAPTPSLKEQLSQAAAESKKTLPRMVDSDTRLDSVTTGPGLRLSYQYTLVRLSKAGVNVETFKNRVLPTLLRRFCERWGSKEYPREGFQAIYRYLDRDGLLLAEIPVTPDDCRRDIMPQSASKSDLPKACHDLFYAASAGDADNIKRALDQGADPNCRLPLSQGGTTALMVAATNGGLDVVEPLLKKGALPNLQDKAGETALIFASSLGRTDVVRALLKAGANPNIKWYNGSTALDEARKAGKTEVVNMLAPITRSGK